MPAPNGTKLCLYIAQHRMTGTERDISQYISLALYLTPPPQIELSTDLAEMPPDSTQVAEIVPLLKDFVDSVDLHGIWLAVHPIYDHEADRLHDPLSHMIVGNKSLPQVAGHNCPGPPVYRGHRANALAAHWSMPASTAPTISWCFRRSTGRFAWPMFATPTLHYVIEPLLYARANAIDRSQPILKEIREAPIAFRYRNDTVPLTVECLIKAIEARTMDTGVPVYTIPAGTARSELPRYEHERQIYQDKVDAVRLAAVHHDMTQGFVLTQYFYEQLIQFEKDPASLSDNIGEMVYSMDVDQQVHRARMIDFDKEADEDVLVQSKPRKLTGLDLAEARLAAGDVAAASSIAQQFLAERSDSLDAVADSARANFILARAAAMTGHPEDAIDGFQRTLATTKEPRLLAWSHIYLGRMLDLDCKRDEAVSEYKLALENRDGQQDTRLAAERGVKAAYAVKGHSCDEDADDDTLQPAPTKPDAGQNGIKKQ